MAKSKFNTAEVSSISIIPDKPLQGLMTEKGKFFVAVPQIAERFQFDTRQASRAFKALLGKGFQFDTKLKTKLNPKAVNAVTLEDYERLVFKLVLKGNEIAIAETELIIGLGYRQMFCDSFGIEFDVAAKHEFLKLRYQGIQQRHGETDAVKIYLDRHPELSPNALKFMYSNVTDSTYRAIFGVPARTLYAELEERGACKKSGNLRDCLPTNALSEIENMERMIARLIVNEDIPPMDAVKEAADRLMVKRIDIAA